METKGVGELRERNRGGGDNHMGTYHRRAKGVAMLYRVVYREGDSSW